MFMKFMMGHLFGVPFHKELQHEIIVALLQHLENATDENRVSEFGRSWAEVRKEGKRIEALRCSGS